MFYILAIDDMCNLNYISTRKFIVKMKMYKSVSFTTDIQIIKHNTIK